MKKQNNKLHYINERMVKTKFEMDIGPLNMTEVYAPKDVRKDHTERFYEDLQHRLNKCNWTDHVLICGDLNSKVGNLLIPGVV